MTKKGHQKFWRRKATFFRKVRFFSRESSIFPQSVKMWHDLGFSGFFAVARLGFSIFVEWQHWMASDLASVWYDSGKKMKDDDFDVVFEVRWIIIINLRPNLDHSRFFLTSVGQLLWRVVIRTLYVGGLQLSLYGLPASTCHPSTIYHRWPLCCKAHQTIWLHVMSPNPSSTTLASHLISKSAF